MAYLAWKQNVGVSNLTPEKAKVLLQNFRYPTSIDNKGKLRINCTTGDIKLGFEPNGNSTIVGVSSTPQKPWALILFIIFLCCCVVPGVIYSIICSIINRKIFIEAVQVMNQNLVNTKGDLNVDVANSGNSNLNSNITKKNKKNIIWIVVAIILGMGIIGAICGVEGSDTNGNPTVGKWCELDKNYDLKVTEVKQINYLQKNEILLKPDEGNIYIGIYIEYKNKSDVPVDHLYITSAELKNFYIQTSSGKKYEPDVLLSSILFYETLDFTEKIDFELGGYGYRKGYLKPYSESYESGKNGFAIEIPKSIMSDNELKLVINTIEIPLKF